MHRLQLGKGNKERAGQKQPGGRTVMKEVRGDGSKMERRAGQSSGQRSAAKFNCGFVPAEMKRLSDRVSLIVLSVGSANESEPLNQNP